MRAYGRRMDSLVGETARFRRRRPQHVTNTATQACPDLMSFALAAVLRLPLQRLLDLVLADRERGR